MQVGPKTLKIIALQYSSITSRLEWWFLLRSANYPNQKNPCQSRIFGFHIHKETDHGDNMDGPFADACLTTIRTVVNTRTTPGICRRRSETTDFRCAHF